MKHLAPTTLSILDPHGDSSQISLCYLVSRRCCSFGSVRPAPSCPQSTQTGWRLGGMIPGPGPGRELSRSAWQLSWTTVTSVSSPSPPCLAHPMPQLAAGWAQMSPWLQHRPQMSMSPVAAQPSDIHVFCSRTMAPDMAPRQQPRPGRHRGLICLFSPLSSLRFYLSQRCMNSSALCLFHLSNTHSIFPSLHHTFTHRSDACSRCLAIFLPTEVARSSPSP